MQPPEDDMELIMDTGIAFASTYVAPQATNRQGQVDQAPADDDVRLTYHYPCRCHDSCYTQLRRKLSTHAEHSVPARAVLWSMFVAVYARRPRACGQCNSMFRRHVLVQSPYDCF